jgi:hypothetical protein
VYYLSGTTGWDATFDGIPTAIYSIAPPPTLGITIYGSNSFPAVFFLIETGTNFVLQTTTNLSSGPWMAVTNGIPFSEVSNGIPVSGLIITNVQPAAFFRLH